MTNQLNELDRLHQIMIQLRDPETGCPWDAAQDFASIAPYTIEEAYEVADAIQQGDRTAIRDELGDLLLQVVFHARIAEEEGSFALEDVAKSIADKMVAVIRMCLPMMIGHRLNRKTSFGKISRRANAPKKAKPNFLTALPAACRQCCAH